MGRYRNHGNPPFDKTIVFRSRTHSPDYKGLLIRERETTGFSNPLFMLPFLLYLLSLLKPESSVDQAPCLSCTNLETMGSQL